MQVRFLVFAHSLWVEYSHTAIFIRRLKMVDIEMLRVYWYFTNRLVFTIRHNIFISFWHIPAYIEWVVNFCFGIFIKHAYLGLANIISCNQTRSGQVHYLSWILTLENYRCVTIIQYRWSWALRTSKSNVCKRIFQEPIGRSDVSIFETPISCVNCIYRQAKENHDDKQS